PRRRVPRGSGILVRPAGQRGGYHAAARARPAAARHGGAGRRVKPERPGYAPTMRAARQGRPRMESRAKALGHAIHPMLIVFPLGLLTTAVIFDILFLVTDRNGFATAAA